MNELGNGGGILNIPTLIPDTGLLHRQDDHRLILCKPKLMPLKSVTLEKLEKMQKEAEEKLKEQQLNSSQ